MIITESQLRSIIKQSIQEALSHNQIANMRTYLSNSDKQNLRYQSDGQIAKNKTFDNMYKYRGKTSNVVVQEIQEILNELKAVVGRLDNARKYLRKRFGLTTNLNANAKNKRNVNRQYGKEYDAQYGKTSSNSHNFVDPSARVAANPENRIYNPNQRQGLAKTNDVSNKFGRREKAREFGPNQIVKEGVIRNLIDKFKNNKDDKRRDAEVAQMLPDFENEINKLFQDAENCITMAKTATDKDVNNLLSKYSELRKQFANYYRQLNTIKNTIMNNSNIVDTDEINRQNRKAYIADRKKQNDLAAQSQNA